MAEQESRTFAFREMRRFKQKMSEKEIRSLLHTAKRGVLSVMGEGGYPYGLPVNFLFDEEKNRILIHCSGTGHKIDAVKNDPRVCFTVLSEGYRDEGAWWYHVDSVILYGRAVFIESGREALEATEAIGRKYFPEGYDIEEELRKNGPGVCAIEIRIDHASGKHVKEK